MGKLESMDPTLSQSPSTLSRRTRNQTSRSTLPSRQVDKIKGPKEKGPNLVHPQRIIEVPFFLTNYKTFLNSTLHVCLRYPARMVCWSESKDWGSQKLPESGRGPDDERTRSHTANGSPYHSWDLHPLILL